MDSRGLRVLMLAGLAVWARSAAASDADEELSPKPTGPPIKMSAWSRIEVTPYSDGRLIEKSFNTRFDFVELSGAAGRRRLLLRQEIELRRPPGPVEGWDRASVRLTATELLPGGKSAKRYQIEETGQEARVMESGEMWMVTQEGCCDTESGYAIYSLHTGDPVLYSSGWSEADALAPVKVPNLNASRWVGVVSDSSTFSSDAFEEPYQHKRETGETRMIVAYASSERTRSRVLLEFGPEIGGRHLVQAVESRPDGVVRIRFDSNLTADLPIKDDAVDVARARLSDGMTATALPAAWPKRKPRPAGKR
jgi:hypothetical protein